jgi:hypothetical protein
MNSKSNIVNIVNTNTNPVSNILSCVLFSNYTQSLYTTNFIIRYFYFHVSVCTITSVVLSYVLLLSFYPSKSYVVAMLVTPTYSFLHIMCLIIICCVIHYYFKKSIRYMLGSLRKTKTSNSVTLIKTHIKESYVSPRYVAFHEHNTTTNHCSNNIYNRCAVFSCMIFSICCVLLSNLYTTTKLIKSLIKSKVDKVGTKSSDVISRIYSFCLDILGMIIVCFFQNLYTILKLIVVYCFQNLYTTTKLIINLINVPTFIYNFLRYRLDILLDSILHYIKFQRAGSKGRVLMTIDTLSETTNFENYSKAHKSIYFIITNYLTYLMYTILCNFHNVVSKTQCSYKDFFHRWIPVMYYLSNSRVVYCFSKLLYTNKPKNCPIQGLTSCFAKMLFNTKKSCLSHIRQLFLSFANVVNYCGVFIKYNCKFVRYNSNVVKFHNKCTKFQCKYIHTILKIHYSFINYKYNRVITKTISQFSLSNPFY